MSETKFETRIRSGRREVRRVGSIGWENTVFIYSMDREKQFVVYSGEQDENGKLIFEHRGKYNSEGDAIEIAKRLILGTYEEISEGWEPLA